MRRQWPCSKCGFECTSTWRSWPPSKPVICKACSKSKEKNGVEDNQAEEQVPDDGTRSSTQLSGGNSSSEISTNIATVHGDHVCRGSSSKISSSPLLENTKRENDYEDMPTKELEKQSVWDPNSVHKKKRSKLPQYTLSSVERLLHKLQQVESDDKRNIVTYEKQMFDDFLIYEKFKSIPQNEIGLGAKVFYPPIKAIKQEPYTGDEDGSCLFDVPITGPSE